MFYRTQALFLGMLFMIAGAVILLYDVLPSSSTLSSVAGSIIAFMGLGLLLIGALILFAAPETLVPSSIVTKAIRPYTANLSMIVASLTTEGRALHVPKIILGGESDVLLVLSRNAQKSGDETSSFASGLKLEWNGTRKVLSPLGIELMKGFESTLKRDFLALDVQQLGRLLGRAIVTELQLASGFSLREISLERYECTWVRPAVTHLCVSTQDGQHPEFCYLCSAVACGLAKATGRPVLVEKSNSDDPNLKVTATYSIISGDQI